MTQLLVAKSLSPMRVSHFPNISVICSNFCIAILRFVSIGYVLSFPVFCQLMGGLYRLHFNKSYCSLKLEIPCRSNVTSRKPTSEFIYSDLHLPKSIFHVVPVSKWYNNIRRMCNKLLIRLPNAPKRKKRLNFRPLYIVAHGTVFNFWMQLNDPAKK